MLFVFLYACKPVPILDESQDIPEDGWSYNAPVSFEFSIVDTAQTYDLILAINHMENYTFENLYLKIETIFPDKKKVEDVLSIEMTNDVGQWISKCKKQDCTLKIFLQDDIYFKQVGDHRISFQQFSREATLQGISKLQFKIIPAA